ncbi:MAG: SUMF1/EgtB/PvdO family nonheme iron enzyme [Muribaculaceae bacterium]|nr:SUMF1/EgtB/PvdO family nonheme iron enzyme [Muribaculaceae bacterium]
MKKYIKYSILSLAFSAMTSCSSQDDVMQDLENNGDGNRQTVEVVMNVSKDLFSDETPTRSAAAWENGDVVYLIFDSYTYGEAVYNSGKWTMSYFGSLESGSNYTCQAVFLENIAGEVGTVATLDQNSAIYEDASASCSYDGSALTVTAVLSPKTGRIKFDGSAGTSFKIYGISYYTGFNTQSGKFTLTKGMLTSTVESNSTPYIYGFFNDTSEPRINIIYTENAYTRQFSSDIYQPGQSGYVTLPTPTAHSNWKNNAIFKFNGAEFTMIPVEYSEGNFLLGETELTEAQYYAIISEGNSSRLPKSNISYSECNKFCTKLYKISNLNFRFPTTTEWQYAFEGGNRSKGYTYSGSDNIYEVAWFNDNSDDKRHEVGQLMPNELGFYDMSGNVSEFVEAGSNYPNSFGGSYSSNSSNCKVNSYSTTYSYNYGYNYIGVRLTLSND